MSARGRRSSPPAILSEDEFRLAEECRLFYMALTRARRSVVWLTVEKQFSVFPTELVDSHQFEVIGVDAEVAAINASRSVIAA